MIKFEKDFKEIHKGVLLESRKAKLELINQIAFIDNKLKKA